MDLLKFMAAKIERLAVFESKKIENWVFRVSISNTENIMIMCYDTKDPLNFIIRFFLDEEEANAFVIEASMGKHSP